MFSNIKRLKVYHKLIHYTEFKPGNDYEVPVEVDLPDFFNQTLKKVKEDREIYLDNNKTTLMTYKDNQIAIGFDDGCGFEFYAPRELRYLIYKDLNKTMEGSCFDLDYRKHLRAIHSRKNAYIQFINFNHPEMVIASKQVIDEVYETYKQYSTGKADRPFIVFAADIMEETETDMKFIVHWTIAKEGRVLDAWQSEPIAAQIGVYTDDF